MVCKLHQMQKGDEQRKGSRTPTSSGSHYSRGTGTRNLTVVGAGLTAFHAGLSFSLSSHKVVGVGRAKNCVAPIGCHSAPIPFAVVAEGRRNRNNLVLAQVDGQVVEAVQLHGDRSCQLIRCQIHKQWSRRADQTHEIGWN